MHIHLIGICGTGMGALALLLREAGHTVTGSDANFDPPIGPALQAASIVCMRGYKRENLEPRPDLVVVGNVIRRDNPEASHAEALSIERTSMSGALRRMFLTGRRPLIVAGTHGKTTTSAMCAWLLETAGFSPGWFIGGVPKNLPSGANIGETRRKLTGSGAPLGPFVIEGDEYDAVYWHKQPKFFDYVGVSPQDVAIVTSVEFDHVDIYPTVEAYERAFSDFMSRIPEAGLLVCSAHDKRLVALASAHARCRVVYYGIEHDGDTGVTPTWVASKSHEADGLQYFDVYASGVALGRHALKVSGEHNVRNALAAMAACAEGFSTPIRDLRSALASFEGVKRRQEIIGTINGVTVYDDFAHHPTAVSETLRGMKRRHTRGRLFAAFEPRSATAVRNVHQHGYECAFDAADRVLIAPLGRSNIPESERLRLPELVTAIGQKATACESVDAIVDVVVAEVRSGDVVALLSNGVFGGIHHTLLERLKARG